MSSSGVEAETCFTGDDCGFAIVGDDDDDEDLTCALYCFIKLRSSASWSGGSFRFHHIGNSVLHSRKKVR